MYTKQAIFALFIIFASRALYAQENSSLSKGNTAFFDDFSKNRNGWPEQSGENYNFSFKGRKYDMDSSREGMITPVLYTKFDHDKDYTITCILTHISGLSESGYGLTFSYKNNSTSYHFEIVTKGYYRVTKVQDNMETQVIPWAESLNIEKENGKPNKLKICKKGKTCELYINDTMVNSFNDFDNEGDYTGFIVENKHHIEVTLLSIQYN